MQDAEYPDRLRNIYDPPIALYVRGNLHEIDDIPVVAIVGTRDCTPYGITSAENVAYTLAQHGIVIATGLARGIDSAAARGALRGGGRVLGVIGSGLDIVYPSENKTLFDDVAGAGALVSEYAPGVPAIAAHFPARNRIISGLSLGVAVIEAPKRSGALITAARALEQGRDVFTLPGNVDARCCEGSNALLREGAIPILSGEDIVNEYADLFPAITITEAEQQPTQKPVRSKDREHTSAVTISGISDADSKPPEQSAGDHTGNADNKKEIDNATEVDYIGFDKFLCTLEGDERTVAETIGKDPLLTDEIIVSSGLTTPQVLTALTMLEIKGNAVRENSGKWRIVTIKE